MHFTVCRFLMHLAPQLKPLELCGLQTHFHLLDANCNGTIEFKELLTVCAGSRQENTTLLVACHIPVTQLHILGACGPGKIRLFLHCMRDTRVLC
jgi:hypothetical protein